MTTIKVFNSLLAACFVAVFFSCSGGAGNTKETSADTTAAAAATPAATTTAPFTPFDVVEVSHVVKDYGAWRPLFDADSINRKASGMEKIIVGRGVDNPNNVIVVLKVSDIQKGKDFTASPQLKEVMTKAGVISKPDAEFFHVIRLNPDSKEKQWVIVSHKVKDFDAWLKVYDGEGKEKRASEGLVDVVLARGIDDPSMVHLVFDITDMAKAKKAIFSDEKKKLMTSAGVEGEPKIEFYQTAE